MKFFKSEFQKLTDLYDKSPTIDEWEKDNIPDEDLIYRSGAGGQCSKARAIVELMNLERGNPDCFRVVSTHTSKSVCLPVIAFRKRIVPYNLDAIAVFRDNFHDLCCQVISSHSMDLPFNDVYNEVTLEWLENKRKGAIEYKDKSSGYWENKTKPKEEVIYEQQMQEPGNWNWYEKYASTKVLEQNSRYFLINYGWYEGFPCGGDYHSRKYYEGPTNDFSFLANGYLHLALVFYTAFNMASGNAINEARNK